MELPVELPPEVNASSPIGVSPEGVSLSLAQDSDACLPVFGHADCVLGPTLEPVVAENRAPLQWLMPRSIFPHGPGPPVARHFFAQVPVLGANAVLWTEAFSSVDLVMPFDRGKVLVFFGGFCPGFQGISEIFLRFQHERFGSRRSCFAARKAPVRGRPSRRGGPARF